jgi:hypothetical protein
VGDTVIRANDPTAYLVIDSEPLTRSRITVRNVMTGEQRRLSEKRLHKARTSDLVIIDNYNLLMSELL